MSRVRLAGWVLLCLSLFSPSVKADNPATNPQRLVPEQAELLVSIPNPRGLYETITSQPLFQQLNALEAIRDLYDTTNSRRLNQLLAYFEKQLGCERLELLDRVAGNGMALAAKFSGGTPAVLGVIQGKDEKTVQAFAKLALDITEQELARQEIKGKIQKNTYKGAEVVRLGDKVFLAVTGATILAASDAKVLQKALDLGQSAGKGSLAESERLSAARKYLPDNPQAWVWLDLEKLRMIGGFKDGLNTLTLDPAATFVFGGLVDVINRAPFLTAGITYEGANSALSVRFPVGREGMSDRVTWFLPPPGSGTLPPLEPRNVLSSTSYVLDLGHFWENREKILRKQDLKNLEELEKNSGRFLGGARVGNLLKQVGANHRVVVAQQSTTVYKKEPGTKFPAFALVVDMRDPAFGQSMDAILRGAALIAGFQFNLKMTEETLGDTTLVSYAFSEDQPLKADPRGQRFNFTPSFARVGDHFLASSTVELGRDLVGLLAGKDVGKSSPASFQTRVYGTGVAGLLRGFEELLLTETILAQAVPVANAREQVQAFIRVVEQMGVLHMDINYGQNEARYEFKLAGQR